MMNAESLLVFYDANCNLCQAGRSALSESDALLEFVDIHEPKIAERFPQLRGRALGCEMHVMDEQGELTAGYDALVTIASRTSSMQPFMPLLRWKPFQTLGRILYQFIADNRYTIFGGTRAVDTCELMH